jgi:hypothetical protein
MRKSALLVGLVSLLASSSVVVAQPGGEPEPPPPPDQPPPPDEPPPADPVSPPSPPPTPVVVQPPPPPMPTGPTTPRGVLEDANSGRNWLTPTALTPPAGTFSFSDFELLLVGAAYSPTDQLQLSATTLLPIVEDMPLWILLSGKFAVLQAGQLHLAVQGTFNHIRLTDTDINGNDETDSFSSGSLGGALTYCFDAHCYSHVTGYLAGAFAYEAEANSSIPFVASVSAVFKVARLVRLVFEADTGFIIGDISEDAEGFLGWYGVRFTSRSIGVDLGFVKPVGFGDDGGLVMGVPFVSFTYRHLRGD